MNEEELKRTFEEINLIDRQDFLEGFIRELNNYGFTSEYLGVFSAQIVALFEKEIKFSGDSLTEFWDNPEDDRWDKEEEKQDESRNE